MPSPARIAALDQLDRVESEGAFVGHFTSDETKRLDARDRRQTTEYVAGVTRWRRHLDFLLAEFYNGDLAKMEAPLRQILRLGLYEVLHMHTPPHAAVDEAVELAKRRVRRGAGGLTNGILRAILRSKEKLPEPASGDAADDLAVRHSHPTWMVRRWLERFGPEETDALLQWNNARPTYHIRVNTLRQPVDEFLASLPQEQAASSAAENNISGSDESGAVIRSPYMDDFLRVGSLQPLLDRIRSGDCAVQDESAGLVVRLLDPQPGESLLDGCAAPGGKTLYAAALMQNDGNILANDAQEGKLARLEEMAGRMGIEIIRTHVDDLRELEVGTSYDAVLVDAPCSGLGVLAKRADLRWRRSPEDLTELAQLQAELLDAAARHVVGGGRLIYGTCTTEPEENEAVIQDFLDRHSEFAVESAAPYVPEEMVTGEGYFASLPHRDGIDGAFGVRLRKT